MNRLRNAGIAGCCAIAAIGLSAACLSALASDEYAAVVNQELTAIQRSLQREGFRTTHRRVVQEQVKTRPITFTLQLNANLEIAIAAACDQDCDDVDIRVMDAQNRVVVEDAENSDRPEVRFVPEYSGLHQVEVSLPGCRAQRSCHIGIIVLGR